MNQHTHIQICDQSICIGLYYTTCLYTHSSHSSAVFTPAWIFTRNYFRLSEMCQTIMTRSAPPAITILALQARFYQILGVAF